MFQCKETTIKAPEISTTTKKKIDALIAEATVDAYDESEQFMGLTTIVIDEVEIPFDVKVVGEPVTIIGFENGPGMVFKAVCQRGKRKYKIDVGSIEWTSPLPKGFKWIEAFLEWQRRG